MKPNASDEVSSSQPAEESGQVTGIGKAAADSEKGACEASRIFRAGQPERLFIRAGTGFKGIA